MGKEVRLFKSEEPKSRAEVAAFMRQLAGKLEAGEVVLRQGQEELTLAIPADLVLEIQVEDEQKKGDIQHSLEIEIKWYDNPRSAGSLELG